MNICQKKLFSNKLGKWQKRKRGASLVSPCSHGEVREACSHGEVRESQSAWAPIPASGLRSACLLRAGQEPEERAC